MRGLRVFRAGQAAHLDLNRTRQLAPRLSHGVTVISESGIHNYAQVRELSRHTARQPDARPARLPGGSGRTPCYRPAARGAHRRNNRDLRDLSIDLNRTRQLAPRLSHGVTVISESGISTPIFRLCATAAS
jgi:hypothetical protein